MEAALKGDWREEHLFVLKQALETYRHLQGQIADSDVEMEKALELVNGEPCDGARDRAPKEPSGQRGSRTKEAQETDPGQRAKPRLERATPASLRCRFDAHRRVQRVERFDSDLRNRSGYEPVAQTPRRLGAWLGLCPGNKISGGKVLSSRTAPCG